MLRLRIPALGRGPDAGPRQWGHLRPAGEMRRPDLDERVERIAELRKLLVRVLDDEGKAVGEWVPQLSPDDVVVGLTDMMRLRAFDARMMRAHRQGHISFYVQNLGEEAITCAQWRALDPGDMHFPTYRCAGLLVASGYPLTEMVNQILSNESDPLKGRQLPVLYSARAHGFFTVSGNLGTQYPQAVGWAMASALRGGTAIASAWIGEGSTAESDFHAALLFASTYRAPVILNVTNNQWAISTPADVPRGASATFADRGFGYSIPAIRVDGNDYLAVYAASRWAALRARSNLGPTLIEWVTLRAGAHSTSDDPSVYRPPGEVETFPLGDPVDRLRHHLEVLGVWDEERHRDLTERVEDEVNSAFDTAMSHGAARTGGTSDPLTMFDDVYATPPPHLQLQRSELVAVHDGDERVTADGSAPRPRREPRAGRRSAAVEPVLEPAGRTTTRTTTTMSMIEAIRDAHMVAMERDDRIVVFGQDVGYFGGVFRCTQGVQARFGPERCFDTPINESGIVGTAVGMAAHGLRPCVEIQFADYMYPAYDQIVSEAARIRHRSAGEFSVPMVIRMPTGGGIYGGQTHSQSPEALFTHVAGLTTVVVSNPYDAKGLLLAALRR